MNKAKKESQIAVIGLGYVGLPLAVAFGEKYSTIGYDLSEDKIAHFEKHQDPTGEVSEAEFQASPYLRFTSDPSDIKESDFIIIAVPTPIDAAHKPDLKPLISSSRAVGENLKKEAVIVYESTVYPGVTEEVCVPVIEKYSGLKWRRDFHVGYSPERINPGDKEHTLTKITKVVSGDDAATLDAIADLYGSIIDAGVYRVECIKEAEAAKVIENIQRDLNIALINELAIIFDQLGIDTLNVLEAAGTKWNFLPFRPGLVGGHCIGVDPYYLTYKAELVGYHSQVILSGRRINDSIGKFVAEKTVKEMIKAGQNVKGGKVGVFGLTFKEDCPDLRNSRVPDIISELESYGIEVLVHDPLAEPEEAESFYNVTLTPFEQIKALDAIVLAVAHSYYKDIPKKDFIEKLVHRGCLIDVKSFFNPTEFDDSGIHFWRL